MLTQNFLRRATRRDDRGRAARARVRPTVESLDGRLLMDGATASVAAMPMVAAAATPMPMSADAQAMLEHEASLNLVPTAEATHVATASGDWSTIWGANTPGADARVWIPAGVTVTVDDQSAAALKWIRVDGTLRFAEDRDTALKVETIVVSPTGNFVMGTAARPIAADRQARVTFADLGPIDRAADPLALGRGLIDHGGISIYGARTTSFVPLAQAPRAGDAVLKLASVPVNWRVGGRLVVPGVDPNPARNQDEEVTIRSIQGTQVTLSRPLAYDHSLPSGVALPLAYLDRNAVLTSENQADPNRRGYIMVMMEKATAATVRVVAYAELEGLGRTRADILVTDPMLDADGKLIPSSDPTGNVRGRYSLHFHKTGISDPDDPNIVLGISIVDGLKWGLVNHSSNVDVRDSLAYNVDGAGFATEVGNEIGSFTRNLSVRSSGSGTRWANAGFDLNQLKASPAGPPAGFDMGFQGHGFWVQSAGTPLVDNITIGAASDAFAIFTMPLTASAQFPVSNLPAAAQVYGKDLVTGRPRTTVPVGWVPFTFTGNTAIGAKTGLAVYHSQSSPDAQAYKLNSTIADSTFVNVKTGVFNYYANRIVMTNDRMINDASRTLDPYSTGVDYYGSAGDHTYDNLTIVNFRVGINMAQAGDMRVKGGFFQNVINIFINNAGASNVTLDVGPANFATPTPAVLKALQTGRQDKPWNIYLATLSDPTLPDITRPFRTTARRVVLMVDGKPQRLYFRESARDYRFDTADDFEARSLSALLPQSMQAMTAGQLWDSYGLAANGVIAPADAYTLPGVHAVASSQDVATPPPAPTLASAPYTNQLNGYVLKVSDAKGVVSTLATVDLKPDQWNFVKATYQGRPVTMLVYAKAAPPTLRFTDASYNYKTPTTISRAELQAGYTVYGLVQNVIGKVSLPRSYKQVFRPDQLVVGADGKVRLTLTFADMAGNTASTVLVLNVV